MKKKTIYLLVLLSIISLSGCATDNNNSSNNSASNNSTLEFEDGYKKVSSVDNLFKTYNNKGEFNFELEFSCDVVYHREYYDSWETDYLFNGNDIQITYESNGQFYTDYYHEDVKNNTYTYLIDMGGGKKYQSIDGTNEYFFQYYSQIDQINIDDIDWTNDFIFNLEENKAKPINESITNEIAKKVLGDKANEYFDSFVVTYEEGYITSIESVSIYREATYYYHLKLDNHDWVDFDLPVAEKEYEGFHPYFNKEVYEGTALSSAQVSAIEVVPESKPNYTVDTTWTYVDMEDLIPARSVNTHSVYDNDKQAYTWTNASTKKTYTDYLVENSLYGYVCFKENDYGTHDAIPMGDDNFEIAISLIAQDQINITGLDSSSYIYNGTYIMPKDLETEQDVLKQIFGQTYGPYYHGLHIYLTEDESAIDKVETSLFIEYDDGTIMNYVKVFTISDIGTSSITLPEDCII